jgi:hypothetical protein
MERSMKTLPQPWTTGDGGHRFHRVNLRSPAATRRGAEGGPPADAAGHCGREKEERIVSEICDCPRYTFLPDLAIRLLR